MANEASEYNAFRDMFEEAHIISRLARDGESFRRAYRAFREGSAEEFREVLGRAGLLERCGLVCEWIRSKECVFLCLELCGPPRPTSEAPNDRRLAEAVVRLTSNEQSVQALARAVETRDREVFARLMEELEIGELCHYVCHWLCVVRYRLLCHWVCSPIQTERPNLATELRAAGHAVRSLLEHKDSFDQAVAAAGAGDAAKMKSIIGGASLIPFCHFICEWFCSRRCTYVCLTLCREFPPFPIKDEIDEALQFARASERLAQKPDELHALSTALGTGDSKAWEAILNRLELTRYCIQLCHWVCSLRCYEICVLVCPPPNLYPQFTSIGVYDYLTDVHSALGGNGLTIADSRAFYSTMRLNGILTQTLGGQPMEYRFETATTDAAGNPTGTWTPVLPAQIARTEIGHWEHWNTVTLTLDTKKYTVNGTAGPTELVATIASDGWIQVPQENNFTSPAGAFFANGNMIELISPSLAPFLPADETGVTAGGPAAHPLAQDLYFGIRMRVRQVGVPASETDGGTCVHAAIDNTLYNDITLHPYWNGGLQPPGRLGIAMLDISELISHPCSEIGNSLTVKFTAAHPNLGPVGVTMAGPGGPYNFTLPPLPEVGDWYGIATPTGFTISSLKPCAYLVTLQVILLLTDGDNPPSPIYDQIAFCKH